MIFGNKCLDVTNGLTVDGTKLQIWTCTSGNTNQQFYYTVCLRFLFVNYAATDFMVLGRQPSRVDQSRQVR